jgi:hypothetical protein
MKICNPSLLKSMRTPGPCELCGVYCTKREIHHLLSKTPRVEIRCSLISVGCSTSATAWFKCQCHYAIHSGRIPREDVLWAVAKREGVLRGDIEDLFRFIRRLVKPTPSELEESLRSLKPAVETLARKEFMEAGIL